MDLGSWMSALANHHYGVKLDELGHIEHDDTVWATVRRHKPLLVDSPASKAARNIERIARRVMALTTRLPQETSVPSIPSEHRSLYAVLGVAPSSNDEEIRKAYKRHREVYANGGLATTSLLSDAELHSAQAVLDEAYDTLLDPIRRRAYDMANFPTNQEEVAVARATRPALVAEQLMLKEELARELGHDTMFTGELLRKVRESQGIDLADISAITKISKAHLQALESENFAELPASVYVRGFLGELSKCLRLDASVVQKTYLRRMRAALATKNGVGS
jgi:flagellar biosynthesis protein FlhG